MQIPELTVNYLKEVISEWTGVPIGQIRHSAMTTEQLSELEDYLKTRIIGAVREFFRPELLGRIDKAILFRRLQFSNLVQIVKLEFLKLQERLAGNLRFSPTQAALKELARRSVNMDTNAREVSKIVQKEIEEKLVQLLVDYDFSLSQQQTISINIDKDRRFHLQDSP